MSKVIKKKPSTWWLLPLAVLVGLVLYRPNMIIHGALFDIVFLVITPFFVVDRFKKHEQWFWLWVPLSVFWIVDLWLYLQSVPLAGNVLSPLLAWLYALNGGLRAVSLGWMFQTIGAGLLLLLFIGALKKSSPTASYLSLFALFFTIGFVPAWSQTRQNSVGSIRMEISDPAQVRELVTNKQGHTIISFARHDVDVARSSVMGVPGRLLVVAFNPVGEEDFFFSNAGKYDVPDSLLPAEIKKSGALYFAMQHPTYIRGTFHRPCDMKAGFMDIPADEYPINPNRMVLSISTPVVKIGRHECQPIINDLEVYLIMKPGEIQIGHNMPRGSHGWMNDNADGKQNFRVWVVEIPQSWLDTNTDLRAQLATLP
ncbi:MAG: hypothetical protein ABII24_03060 [bacterium]